MWATAASRCSTQDLCLQVVVDIDGDGSFLMNCQDLATAAIEGLETKVMILNNQHLGMVVQWEDRFYKANRAHTYLGRRVSAWGLIARPGGMRDCNGVISA